MPASPEIETLDQLLGGNMPLAVIRTMYPDQPRFSRGMAGLLASGDLRLLEGGLEVPPWRWQAVLAGNLAGCTVSVTEAGASRVA